MSLEDEVAQLRAQLEEKDATIAAVKTKAKEFVRQKLAQAAAASPAGGMFLKQHSHVNSHGAACTTRWY